MNKPDDKQQALLARAKQQLDGHANSLPQDVQARLALARQQAVAHAHKEATKQTPTRWLRAHPALALAASVALVISVFWLQDDVDSTDAQFVAQQLMQQPGQQSEHQQDAAQALSGAEIMLQLADLSEEEMAIVDDLEFITWLQENQSGKDQILKDQTLDTVDEQRS